MSDLILSAHEISDLLKYDKRNVFDELVANAREAIAAGNAVIIRQTYKDTPPKDIKIFKTVGEIDEWVGDIDLLDDINAISK